MPGEGSSNPLALGGDCFWESHLRLLRRMSRGQLAHEPGSQHPFQVAPGGSGHRELLVLLEPALPEVFWLCLRPMLKTVQSRNGEHLLPPEIKLRFSRAHILGAGRLGTILLFKTCQVETFTETLILLIKQEKTFVVKLMQLWNNRTN